MSMFVSVLLTIARRGHLPRRLSTGEQVMIMHCVHIKTFYSAVRKSGICGEINASGRSNNKYYLSY